MADTHKMLADLWYLVTALVLLIYVFLDGFDLGIGVLTGLTSNPGQRVQMLAAVDPVWDAKELWLLLLTAIVFAVFPGLLSSAAQAAMVPFLAMLAGLAIRSHSIRLRRRSGDDAAAVRAFTLGSTITALAQGLLLGAYLTGVTPVGDAAVPGWPWLSPLAVLVALAVCAGYTLLGATYLLRTRPRACGTAHPRRCAYLAASLFLVTAVVVTVWLPQLHPMLAERWSQHPLACVIGVCALAAGFSILYGAIRRQLPRAPFASALFIVAALFVAFTLSLYPYVVPDALTASQAAAPDPILVYMLTGAGILIPIVLFFNGYQHLAARDEARTEPSPHGNPGGIRSGVSRSDQTGSGR
ncbi:MAG: cytochrome d ubiquinol oxidase subunit II [Gammaproteobacteria bacterium]